MLPLLLDPPLSLSPDTENVFFHHSLSTPFTDPSVTGGLGETFALVFVTDDDSFFCLFFQDPKDNGKLILR
jgi:hypothetical protein